MAKREIERSVFMNTNVNISTELSNAIRDNGVIFSHWIYCQKPEAYDQLNNSNRKLIMAYAKMYPNAFAINVSKNVMKPLKAVAETEMVNFCFDYLINGLKANTILISELLNCWEMKKDVKILDQLYEQFDCADGVCLVWS